MRPQFRFQRRPALLTTLAASGVLLAAKPVFAQNDEPADPPAPPPEDTDADAPAPAPSNTDDPADDPPATTEEPAEPPASTAPPEEEPETTADPETTAEPESTTAEEPTETTAEEPTETTEEAETTEASETEEETTEATMATDTGGDGITGGPTLTRGFGIPEYPAATVPPTYHAPFMQHSTAPDGTVFIAVGAILGAFGLGILLWRVIVGLLLHRSVERAAMAQHDSNNKAGFPAPPAPFYKYTDQGSNMSLNGGAGTAGRGVRRTTRGPIPSSNPSQSNLFFSPTAAASGNQGNRGSTFLPSGFYAAAGGGSNSPNHTHSISLTNLRPDSRGHGAARNPLGPSPPDSPSFPAQRRDMSSSSLNLARPSSQRAPSAYLDDLLADDPGALPPPHMPPQHGPQRNSNLGPGSNRF